MADSLASKSVLASLQHRCISSLMLAFRRLMQGRLNTRHAALSRHLGVMDRRKDGFHDRHAEPAERCAEYVGRLRVQDHLSEGFIGWRFVEQAGIAANVSGGYEGPDPVGRIVGWGLLRLGN